MSAAPAGGGAVPAAERRKGYAHWEGERTAQAWRWWVIARGNLGLAFSSRWVKAILLVSLIPGIVLSGVTYFFVPLSAAAVDGVLDGSLIFAFLVGALVGARLVSEDTRQGAFLAYFSRPITRADYVVGKFVALLVPLLFVTAAPALFAIAADAGVDNETFAERVARESGQDLSEVPNGDFLRQASYLDVTLGVVGWSVVASASTAGIVLGLSALSDRARTAGILWFAFVALLGAASGILQGALREQWPALLSWNSNLNDLSSWFLAVPRPGVDVDPWLRLGVMLATGAVGVLVVVERLRRAEGVSR